MTRTLLLALPLLLLAPLPAAGEDAAAAKPDEVEAGYSRYALTGGYANWDSKYLDAAHRFGKRNSLYGELQQAKRFNLTDREISGGYYQPLGPEWTALLEASKSPEHNFLPKDALSAQLQRALPGGWDAQARLRHAQYNLASTDLLGLTGERYWGNVRAAYTLYLAKLQGAGTAPSHSGQVSYYYSDRNYVTLALSRGRQAESLGPGLGVLLLDVRSVSLSGRHWLTPAWGLSYEALAEQQGNLYSRKGIRLGLRYAF